MPQLKVNTNKMKYLGLSFVVFAILITQSCQENNNNAMNPKDLSNLELVRFDSLFAQTTADELNDIKQDFPFMFPAEVEDEVWLDKIENDALQKELEREVAKIYDGDITYKYELAEVFNNFEKYFKTPAPKVLTLVSKVDYKNRVLYADSLLFIGLDSYLGKDHYFYEGIPVYQRELLDRRYLASDVSAVLVKSQLPFTSNRQFLYKMIQYGKEAYIKSLLNPGASNAVHLGYAEEAYQWSQANERQVWSYFLENDFIYSTDKELEKRFLDLGPFSKFGLQIDLESPSRIGRFIGYQIVEQYMDKYKNTSINELIALDAITLLKQSNYKPKR